LLVKPDASVELLRAALKHDVAEVITGDVPTTAKWAYDGIEPALRHAEARIVHDFDLGEELTLAEKKLIKFADLMELTLFCLEEVEIGNRKMLSMARRALAAIKHRDIITCNTMTQWLFNKVQSEVERRGPVEDLFYDQIIRDSLAR
jgi:5'-deoxynucleotidase YfbR-like HD superfamily hydrolase